jgi:acetamidase/formamidase
MRERVKPTFSCEKPNPILPSSKVELQREYETNLSILHQYDLNHQDFDETSRAALRGATSALMKLSNLNFEQAKQVISAARSQYRQES